MRKPGCAALIVWLTLLSSAAAGADETGTVPAGARLSLELDKRAYFLGENVLVHLVVENVGLTPFSIEMGGDYRGASRHLRFSVSASDGSGRAVPDPNPSQPCLGGLGYSKHLKPGEKYYESLPLLRYRRFDRPGIYRLRVAHDFGWKLKDPSKLPGAEGIVEFFTPTMEQARRVVEDTYALPKDSGGSVGERRKPFADFTTLYYPVYLPLLAPRARAGDERALEALGAMPTPQATQELVRLLENKNLTLARTALPALIGRLPNPRLTKKPPADFDWDYRRRWLVKASWRDEFAPAVRRAGRRLVGEKDVECLEGGAYILECLGKQEDRDALADSLGQAAGWANEPSVSPQLRGACQALTRAGLAMAHRGVQTREKPRTAGDFLLFTCAVLTHEKYRPEGWKAVFVKALRHELPYVREAALEALPLPPPKALRALLPERIGDRDSNVQIAACHVAERIKAPELREPVLAALRTAKVYWLLHAASNAAHALGAERQRIHILAERLDDEGVAAWCLQHLVDNVVANTSGYSSRTQVDAATGRVCKKAWERFLRDRAGALAAGKRFKLSDPSVPFKELFPGFTFYPREETRR